MLNESDMHTYQLLAADFICDKQRCALWVDMGLGKTISTLTALGHLIDACVIRKALVIAPLRVCTSVWRQEAAKWDHTQGLRLSLCTGPQKERLKGLSADADIYLINRENVTWMVSWYIENKRRWDFDAVVIDEASAFRSLNKRFKSLKKIIPQTTVMIELTGTPAPNGLLGLWPQAFLLDGGKALGKTFSGFRSRFFVSDHMGWNWSLKTGAKEEIYSLIGDKVLSMAGADYIELPDRIDLFETVALPDDVQAKYKEFEKNLFIGMDDNITLDAMSAGVLANKLLQFANGAAYYDDQKNWINIHNLKLDTLADIIDDNPSEPILVAYSYRHDLDRLIKRFPGAVLLDKNPDTIERWNLGEIPLLLCHPASAGHGLNLQSGGSIIVWFGMNWNLELYQQMNARLHRQGQHRPVRIVHIIASKTIDERVMYVLKNKNAVQSDLLLALKTECEVQMA